VHIRGVISAFFRGYIFDDFYFFKVIFTKIRKKLYLSETFSESHHFGSGLVSYLYIFNIDVCVT